MKVSELADLADTTVRTVRHYHHLGLLDVPATVGGARDYGLDHLARVLRIRWLVTSGLSLTAIRDLLPAAGPLDSEAVVGELTDVLADIDRHLARLQATRSSICVLIERTENDEDVSPLPAGLSAFYRRLAERMPDDRSRQAMEMERSMATVLAVRGQLPPAVDDLIAALDADDEDDIVSIFESMDGSTTSQFEQHLRAVLDYPLGATDAVAGPVVMANVLGAAQAPSMSMDERVHHLMARIPDAKIHLYGKGERPDRKIGHVNIVGAPGASMDDVRERAERAATWLSTATWTDGWDVHGE